VKLTPRQQHHRPARRTNYRAPVFALILPIMTATSLAGLRAAPKTMGGTVLLSQPCAIIMEGKGDPVTAHILLSMDVTSQVGLRVAISLEETS